MIDLNKFRENASEQNLCSEYSSKWNDRLSRKQLVDLALDSKGADYVCDAIAKGWGVSPEFISTKLSAYINGNYMSNQNGYTSKMYCGYNGHVFANTTLIVLINSDVTVEVPDYSICEIYCTGKVNVRTTGKGRSVFICYGNEADVTITNIGDVNMKRIQKKERDKYDG